MNRVAYFLKAKPFSSQLSENQVFTPPRVFSAFGRGL
jgi:hypothetical protein